MLMTSTVVSLFLGFALGIAAAVVFQAARGSTAKKIAEELLREKEKDRKADMEAVIEHLKVSFGNLSLEALSRSTEEFLKLAKSGFVAERETNIRDLEARKGLIDQQLVKMTTELDKIGRLMKDLEKDRAEKFGELAKHLRIAGEQTNLLLATTGLLREALAGAKTRGQWGERMAEDILRAAGFAENVNYVKQATIEGIGSRPDFTFLLPRGFKLNMDVKFPFDNYLRFLEAGSDIERSHSPGRFLEGREGEDQGSHRQGIHQRRAEHGRLRAPVHSQRTGVRVYSRAGQPYPGGRDQSSASSAALRQPFSRCLPSCATRSTPFT